MRLVLVEGMKLFGPVMHAINAHYERVARAGRLRTFSAHLRTCGLPEAKFGHAVRTAIMG